MSRKRHAPADEPHFLIRALGIDAHDDSSIAPHAHSWGQLIYSVKGVLTVWTDHGSWVVPPHWAVWAPAGVAHGLRFAGAASLRTLYMRGDIAPVASRSAVVHVSPLLRELILRAVREGMLDERRRLHRAMVDLIVDECRPSSASPLDLPLPTSTHLRRVAQHLQSHPSRRESHAALARRFGVGLRTLERGFVFETGLTLGRWRRHARFMEALRHLGGGAAVKQAASDAGYRSTSAFVAAFRSSLGTTPGRYFSAHQRP